MKARIIQGVRIACGNWLDGTMDFESAAEFIKSYADDGMVTIAIARDTMNHFRATRDLKKTMDMIMVMRKARFDLIERGKGYRAYVRLTRPDIPGFIEKDL